MTRFMRHRSFVSLVALAVLVGLVMMTPNSAANAATGDSTVYGTAVAFHSDEGLKIGPVSLAGANCSGIAFWVAQRSNGSINYGVRVVASKCVGARLTTNPPNNGGRPAHIQGIGASGECSESGTSTVLRSNLGAGALTYAKWSEKTNVVWIDEVVDPKWTGLAPLIGGLGGACTPTGVYMAGDGGWKASFDLGPRPVFGDEPSAVTSTCKQGTPTKVKTETIIDSPAQGRYDGIYHIRWTIYFDNPAQLGKGDWYVANAFGAPVDVLSVASPGNWNGVTGARVLSGGAGVASAVINFGGNTYNLGDANGVGKVPPQVGLAVQLVGQGIPTYGGNAYSRNIGERNVGTVGGKPYIQAGPGITDPPYCAFYFGPKIVERADDYDVPFGGAESPPPITTEPVAPIDTSPVPGDEPDPAEPEEQCNFSLTDPSSWLGGGMCAAVGLLAGLLDLIKALVSAVIGLPVKIAAEFGSLLQRLFVPKPSTWGVSGLRDQWNVRPPGSIINAAGSGATSAANSYSAGGCGVIADFTTSDMPSSATLNCATIRNQPGLSALYNLVSMALLGLTGFAMFRMFTGSFSRGSS